MSKTYTIYATKMAQRVNDGVYDSESESFRVTQDVGCYAEFEKLPDALSSRSPSYGNFTAYVSVKGIACRCENYPLSDKLDIDRGVYPAEIETQGAGYAYKNGDGWVNMSMVLPTKCAEDGMFITLGEHPSFGYIPYVISTSNSAYVPYISLVYDEGTLTTLPNYPVGYIDRTQSNEFSWHTTYSGFPVEDIAQTSATLQWKNGSNGAVNSITINGAVTTYTMPANTLPVSDEIYWRVVAVTSEGTTNPEWTQVRTTDSAAVSTAISPSGTYVDGTKAVLFTWNHSTDTGTAQTAYDLQIKSSTGDWTTVQSATTSDEFCNLPANTLPSGTVQWRVRTYNADGTAGSWSNELTIVVIAAPAAPAIQIDVVSPMPQISWTSQEQQAFQVQMGTYDSGLQFGTVKSYKCPVYLPDGSTRMRVRVLNEYNLWSDWTEAVATITNVPKTAPVLVITAGHDAQLTWESNETAAAYWVYRDGERIAKTANTSYTDRLAIGSHTYYVRETYASSDDYTDSNTVLTTMKTDHPIICTLDGTGWISLRFSTNSVQSVQVSEQQEIALAQYAGAVYPVPEVAPYRQRNYSISTAYMDAAACAQFEALLGKRVCVKDQYNNLIVGVITSYAKTSVPFYTAYTATVYEIDKGEYLEDD